MKETSLRILIVEDEPEIRRFLRASLRMYQHEVSEAPDGVTAFAELKKNHPDLMILDLGLPDIDGVEVTRRVRSWSQIPIIILSVRDRESDKINALDAGADDYLTKPFGIGELLARIRVVMRRVTPLSQNSSYRVKDLCVDFDRRQVMVAEKEVQLTPTEFTLLKVLIQNAGRVMTHRQIIHQVWGTAYEDESRLLRVNISNLRQKIEPDPNNPFYIQTELGVGYRFVDSD
jgi:two-component system, OmpR family, KDP operon response regulator KdpE